LRSLTAGAGFLVCGFQKKAPKRLLVGAKAGKSECWCPKPAPYDYHESAIATVARRFHLPLKTARGDPIQGTQ